MSLSLEDTPSQRFGGMLYHAGAVRNVLMRCHLHLRAVTAVATRPAVRKNVTFEGVLSVYAVVLQAGSATFSLSFCFARRRRCDSAVVAVVEDQHLDLNSRECAFMTAARGSVPTSVQHLRNQAVAEIRWRF